MQKQEKEEKRSYNSTAKRTKKQCTVEPKTRHWTQSSNDALELARANYNHHVWWVLDMIPQIIFIQALSREELMWKFGKHAEHLFFIKCSESGFNFEVGDCSRALSHVSRAFVLVVFIFVSFLLCSFISVELKSQISHLLLSLTRFEWHYRLKSTHQFWSPLIRVYHMRP